MIRYLDSETDTFATPRKIYKTFAKNFPRHPRKNLVDTINEATAIGTLILKIHKVKVANRAKFDEELSDMGLEDSTRLILLDVFCGTLYIGDF